VDFPAKARHFSYFLIPIKVVFWELYCTAERSNVCSIPNSPLR
jgi:hypothetical protein